MSNARLKAEVTADNLYNFVVTADYIVDWTRNNDSLGVGVRRDAKRMYSNPFVAMCRDLANASKHFELRSDYRDRVTDEVSVASGYGAGRFGVDAYGVGEPSVIIVREDRSRINALEFADKTLETWREFFAQNGL